MRIKELKQLAENAIFLMEEKKNVDLNGLSANQLMLYGRDAWNAEEKFKLRINTKFFLDILADREQLREALAKVDEHFEHLPMPRALFCSDVARAALKKSDDLEK